MDDYAAADAFLREQSGPPGAYDPETFGEGNIYYLPALMWHTLREDIGDDAFWDDGPRLAVGARQLQRDPGAVRRLGRGDHRRGAVGVLQRVAGRDGDTAARGPPWARHHRSPTGEPPAGSTG